jgi:hypothetical protein
VFIDGPGQGDDPRLCEAHGKILASLRRKRGNIVLQLLYRRKSRVEKMGDAHMNGGLKNEKEE